jgi:hypothetical protein
VLAAPSGAAGGRAIFEGSGGMAWGRRLPRGRRHCHASRSARPAAPGLTIAAAAGRTCGRAVFADRNAVTWLNV